jgi:hypothetical protein
VRFAIAAARRHREADVQVAKVEPKSMGRVSGVVALR